MVSLVLAAITASFVLLPCVALVLNVPVADVLAALTKDAVADAMLLSLRTSVVATIIAVLIGTPAAYAVARTNFPGRRLLDAILHVPLVLPPVVAGVALLMAFGRRGLLGEPLQAMGISVSSTTVAVVVAQVFMGFPLYVQSARAGFQAVPQAHVEASHTLGVSPISTFLRVSVPSALPAIASGVILCWGRAVGEFGATIVFAGNMAGKTRTMPLAILTAMQGGVDAAVALSVVLLAFSCGMFVIARWALSGSERAA